MINVTKSQPAPLCLATEKLKASGDYKCGDVITKIQKDFHNKCYLCEEKGPTTINVEHFVPHKGDVELKYDWNNLFFACGHCNNLKLAKYDDILNCTEESPVIVDVLRFDLKPFPKEKPSITALEQTATVQNTAQLLNEVYNGTTTLKTVESINLSDKLCKEIKSFSDILYEYYYEDGLDADDKEELKKKIRRKLSPEAPFTAFKIWVIKSNAEFMKDFGTLL